MGSFSKERKKGVTLGLYEYLLFPIAFGNSMDNIIPILGNGMLFTNEMM